MIGRETSRHAKPRTLRRILRRLGLSYSKPRPVPRKTAPAGEQNMFKERVKRGILGALVSGRTQVHVLHWDMYPNMERGKSVA